MKESEKQGRGEKSLPSSKPVEEFSTGFDELNLAEFPLASVSDRFLDGTKTVVFEDSAWDRERKARVPRKLTISGSDRYGLPTAKDDDVLLACVQLSSLGEFAARQVHFSRYELLKLLRWKDETRNYRRLSVSLRRWKGTTIYSDRAFFDKARQSWVNKDFGVFDNLYIYEREVEEGSRAPASSWFVWNDVLFESFQAGYLKRLDWDLYCRLESPVAKRLYRFLDKRFYHGNRVEIDLHELAFRKVRLTGNYNVAQTKRSLLKGIEELEAEWELKPLDAAKRFTKEARGRWTVTFERRTRRSSKATTAPAATTPQPRDLECELTKRQIGPAVAEELVAAASGDEVRTAIELFDWYNSRGQERGPGFLVNAIRNSQTLRLPKGFESAPMREASRRAEVSRTEAAREVSRRQEAKRAAVQEERERPFRDFWEGLSAEQREQFESEAVRTTDATKRSGYFRSMGKDHQVFEAYRAALLREHFERSVAQSSKRQQAQG